MAYHLDRSAGESIKRASWAKRTIRRKLRVVVVDNLAEGVAQEEVGGFGAVDEAIEVDVQTGVLNYCQFPFTAALTEH